jgi:serine/threonine-protein kinase ATR
MFIITQPDVLDQVMATMQSMLTVPTLAEETLISWHTFITTLAFKDIGPYVGPTSAAFVAAWPDIGLPGRELVKQAFKYLLLENAEALGSNVDELVRLDSVPDLAPYSAKLDALRATWTPTRQLENLLGRVKSDNVTVAELSLLELKDFMDKSQQHILTLASGDVFDPVISKVVTSLWDTACRDGEGVETLQLLAFDCIGRLGAVDPDRLELATHDSSMILYQNFGDEEESIRFALYLITDVLLGTFRSTSDIKFQSHLAFAIQELLKFCGFTEQLVSARASSSLPLKTRSRWSDLPRHVLEACAPLLQSKYTRTWKPSREIAHPIYPSKPTYREWMQDWTAHLIDRVSVGASKAIFDVFRPVVVDRDVGVARHILPHLVLHVLVSGDDSDAHNLQSEIAAVLMDQVHPAADSSSDRRLLCAQVFRSFPRDLSCSNGRPPHRLSSCLWII